LHGIFVVVVASFVGVLNYQHGVTVYIGVVNYSGFSVSVQFVAVFQFLGSWIFFCFNYKFPSFC
jgi:hypothetical protein